MEVAEMLGWKSAHSSCSLYYLVHKLSFVGDNFDLLELYHNTAEWTSN